MVFYFFAQGIKEYSSKVKAPVTIYSGFRPYGAHAGNILTLGVYPSLLLKSGVKIKKYFVTMDDTDVLNYKFPEFIPKDPPLYLGLSSEVENSVKFILDKLSKFNVILSTSRNMVKNGKVQNAIIWLLENKEKLTKILQQSGFDKINRGFFVGPIDKNAKKAIYQFHTNGERIWWENKGIIQKHHITECNYWMHYTFLIPIKIYQHSPDLVILGEDYFDPGQVYDKSSVGASKMSVMQNIYKFLFKEDIPSVLVSPVLLGSDGRKMSKEFSNEIEYSYEALEKIASSWEEPYLYIPK